jgi:hypothetical protein
MKFCHGMVQVYPNNYLSCTSSLLQNAIFFGFNKSASSQFFL